MDQTTQVNIMWAGLACFAFLLCLELSSCAAAEFARNHDVVIDYSKNKERHHAGCMKVYEKCIETKIVPESDCARTMRECQEVKHF